MAHQIYFFYDATVDDPRRDIDGMAEFLGRQTEIHERRSSADWPNVDDINWMSGNVVNDAGDVGISVEVHIRDVSTRLAWRDIFEDPSAPPEMSSSGMCILTLSGEVDWDIVDGIRAYWVDQRKAAEYDEVDGFRV